MLLLEFAVSALIEKTLESKLPLNAWNGLVISGALVAFCCILVSYFLGIQTP